MIYFDNAATTVRKPPSVAEAMVEALQSLGNSGRAAHAGALDASRRVYETRTRLARLFGCESPSRVCFASNATEALNTALFGLLDPGDHVISTDLEHNSVLRPLYELEKRGAEVSFCPADPLGRINCQDIPRLLKANTKAIVCTHASNLTGNVLDIARIGAFAREHGLIFIVDASQSAGVLPIHMEKMQIDVLCFTGHKALMGPQGTGGICVGSRAEIRPLKMGGTGVQTYRENQPPEYPTRLEAGTLNGHGIAGLNAALAFLEKTGLDTIHAHEISLARRFYEGLGSIPGITVYGDFSTWDRAAIVSLNVKDIPSGEVSDILWEDYQIATRPGAHCAPRLHRALGTVQQGAVRFSFGWYNTEEEVDAALNALREISQ